MSLILSDLVENTQEISVFYKSNNRIKIGIKILLSVINLHSFKKHPIFVFSKTKIKNANITSDFMIFK